MADPEPRPQEFVGVVIGAVLLFGVISLTPIMIMWHHRRRSVSMAEAPHRSAVCEMEQTPVERWLEQQNVPENPEQYAHEVCPICLSALTSHDTLPYPDPAITPTSNRSQVVSPGLLESGQHGYTRQSGIRILKRCNHVFHSHCLASWFEYRRHRCPICQEPYHNT